MFKPNWQNVQIEIIEHLFENVGFWLFGNNSKTKQKFNVVKTVLNCPLHFA